MESILISCAGLGMGNASRVAALMESLHELAHARGRHTRFYVASWGAGLNFLKAYRAKSDIDFEIIELKDYTGARAYRWPKIYLENVRLLRARLKDIRPHRIVLDSDYHFPAYAGRKVPLVSVGQAEDVVQRSRRHKSAIRTWPQFFALQIRERLDSYLQRWFSDLVLVPCFEPGSASPAGKVRRIPLIVRKEFLTEAARATAPAGLLLSGSELEKRPFMEFAAKQNWTVLSPAGAGSVPSQAERIDSFDIVFTQGGLSSISECIARGRFVVAFPMQDHPEQILNAMEAESLGVGLQASVRDLEHLPGLLQRVAQARSRVPERRPKCTGAREAALVLQSQF